MSLSFFGFFMMYKSPYSFRFGVFFFSGRLWIIEKLVKLRYQCNHTNESTLIEKEKTNIVYSNHVELFECCVCLVLSQPLQRPEEERLL